MSVFMDFDVLPSFMAFDGLIWSLLPVNYSNTVFDPRDHTVPFIILYGATLVDEGHRDPLLPSLFKLQGWHPPLPPVLRNFVHNIYIYPWNRDPEFAHNFQDYIDKNVHIPHGPDSVMLST
ncbi:hypothetical protein C8J56DRAFT_1065384 [Mycena floridula]|nr:hypothetical protein C8J56DRAFT_1065384 [Mycena floridula]